MEPAGPAKSAVIWLHGLGADGRDFEPAVPYLGLDDGLGTRFVFPTAPRIPVSVNAGLSMPAWFDIRDLAKMCSILIAARKKIKQVFDGSDSQFFKS